MRRGPVSTAAAAFVLSLSLAACGAEESASEAGTSAGDVAGNAEALADTYPDAVTADPDHYSVAYENDALRIVRVAYGPGESSTMHYHPASCAITLGEPSWSMTEADGTVATNTGVHGEVGCEEEYAHMPENTSDDAAEVYLVEFKDGAAPGTDDMPGEDAVEVDPAHYSVEFENEAARIVRIRYDVGDEGIEHGHPANCVVWLESPAPEGEESSVGSMQCSDAQVHTPAGGDESALELIAVEFKGRASQDGER